MESWKNNFQYSLINFMSFSTTQHFRRAAPDIKLESFGKDNSFKLGLLYQVSGGQ